MSLQWVAVVPGAKPANCHCFMGKMVGFLVPCEGSTYFFGGGVTLKGGGIVGVFLRGTLRSPWLLQIISDTRCWITERMQQVTIDDSVVFEVGKHRISSAWLDLVHIIKITKHMPRLFSSVNHRKNRCIYISPHCHMNASSFDKSCTCNEENLQWLNPVFPISLY